jgi:glycosyltransferase involved in cell wall biosynthesis
LAGRGGSELYVRDLATGLLARGHTPIAYSPNLGEVARELRAATIPVVDDLNALGAPPDMIHGQHHLETMTALLHFSRTPALFVCHGWIPWEESPPRFPRIRRYVAVDHTCRDRLLWEHGLPTERVSVVLNFVDLERFPPRGPLPSRPRRAVLFSNRIHDGNCLGAVHEACHAQRLSLDVLGEGAGNAHARPETVLPDYDLVFATGRSALEAMAVGCAVVLCETVGVGPLVTTGEFERLRTLNFGIRALRNPVEPSYLAREIARYDAADASHVSSLVRVSAGRDAAIEQFIDLYREILAESNAPHEAERCLEGEGTTAAAYLRWLAMMCKHWRAADLERNVLRIDRDHLRCERDRLREELQATRLSSAALQQERDRLATTLEAMQRSRTLRLRNRLVRMPLVGPLRRGFQALSKGRT